MFYTIFARRRKQTLKKQIKRMAQAKEVIRYVAILCAAVVFLPCLAVTASAQEDSVIIATGADVPTDTNLPTEYRFPQEYQEQAVQFLTEDGVPLCGYVLGSGDKGVTLAHANGWMVKSWLPFAEKLVDQGYQVILWEFRNIAPSGNASGDMARRWDLDVQAAAQVLRERGVKEIVSIGCSYGGTATAVAAPMIPELKGLAILSSPCYNQPIDPAGALSQITVPTFFAVSTEDGQGAPGVYQREVEALYEACASSQKEIHIVEGNDHGTDMITIPEEGTQGYATVPQTETQRENRRELEEQLLEFTNAAFGESPADPASSDSQEEPVESGSNEHNVAANAEENPPKPKGGSTIAAVALLLVFGIGGILFLAAKQRKARKRRKAQKRNPPVQNRKASRRGRGRDNSTYTMRRR